MACPTDQGKGMDILGASLEKSIKSCEWVGDLVAIPSKIDKILSDSKGNLIYKKQCLVFKSLVDLVAEHTKQYCDKMKTESFSSRHYTAAGVELLRVLNEGIELVQSCANENFPGALLTILGSLGQFYEIIDDATRYLQMINRLEEVFTVKLTVKVEEWCKILHIDLREDYLHMIDSFIARFGVELKATVEDWRDLLHTELKKAYKMDKDELLNGLKSLKSASKEDNRELVGGLKRGQSKPWLLFNPDFVANGLIPILETGRVPSAPCIDGKELKLEDRLGSGSSGEVLCAKWSNFEVAVKIFGPECFSFDTEIDVFNKMMGANNSSHIVQLLGHWEREVIIGRDNWKKTSLEKCLVLELMTTNLGVLIRKHKIKTLLQSVDIILQIAKAMKHLHEKGVVHGDLKLSSVLIKLRHTEGESYLVKLASFDISQTNSQTGLLKLLPSCGISETDFEADVVTGTSRHSQRVDVFSFGIICCQILTGECLDAGNRKKVLDDQEVLKKTFLKLNIRPVELKDLICNCCLEEEDKRPTFPTICDTLWLLMEQLLSLKPSL